MLWISIFIIFSLAIQAQSVELVPEDFSGEAEISAFALTTKKVDFFDGIDDLGRDDIFTTIFNESIEHTTQVENTTLEGNTESTAEIVERIRTTTKSPTTTKIPITTTTVADTTVDLLTTPVTTTDAPTTNVETTTTTMAPTTTTLPTTTTMIPTTTVKVTTKKPTTTTKSTTKIPTTKPTKPVLTTITSLPIPTTTEAFAFPDPQAPQCSFTDSDFFCDTEIVCFGEGKIDCTDDFDEIIPEIIISKSTSESGSSHDSSDYEEAESETIGEFPPELVGRVSPKQRPFLFKMKELETATPSLSSDASDEDKSSSTTKTTIHITIENGDKTSESSLSSEISTQPSTDSDSSSTSHDSATQTIIIRTETSSNSENSDSSSESTTETIEFSSMLPMTKNERTETTATHVDNTEFMLETNATLNKTTVEDDVSAAIIDDSVETNTEKTHFRNKRDENRILSSGSESSSSSMSISLRVAALEGSNQKMRVRRCRTTGTLYCNPTPTAGNCRGRTLCQLLSSTAETSEKSTSAKGVENWAIAVIAICAIAAALTVSLLIYLVFTSWKKLKVQPHNGVTTLTYVNNTPP